MYINTKKRKKRERKNSRFLHCGTILFQRFIFLRVHEYIVIEKVLNFLQKKKKKERNKRTNKQTYFISRASPQRRIYLSEIMIDNESR